MFIMPVKKKIELAENLIKCSFNRHESCDGAAGPAQPSADCLPVKVSPETHSEVTSEGLPLRPSDGSSPDQKATREVK